MSNKNTTSDHLLKPTSRNDKLLLLAGLNPSIGNDFNLKGLLGHHDIRKMNLNDQRLLGPKSMSTDDLTITKTLFTKTDKYKAT